MGSLEGEWCGRSERRKVVGAAEIVKALPLNWKIELALRQSAGLPSIYCRSYVSPSGICFKSCKDAAFYLRDQSLPNVAGSSKEGKMRQMKNGRHTVPKSVNKVASSSVPEANVNLPAAADDLYDVKVGSLIECSPCGLAFEDMRGLEKHLVNFHKKTTRRFDLPTSEGAGPRTLEKHAVMDCDEPSLDEAHAQQNAQGSSSSQKIAKTQESVPIINGRFKTNCTWCNKKFLCEPVDAETMADASGFICPKCKDKIWGGLERSLSRCYQH